METALEIVAKTIFESWGGSWAAAPGFRRLQARKEALSVLDAVKGSGAARSEAIEFLTSEDMGDLSAA